MWQHIWTLACWSSKRHQVRKFIFTPWKQAPGNVRPVSLMQLSPVPEGGALPETPAEQIFYSHGEPPRGVRSLPRGFDPSSRRHKQQAKRHRHEEQQRLCSRDVSSPTLWLLPAQMTGARDKVIQTASFCCDKVEVVALKLLSCFESRHLVRKCTSAKHVCSIQHAPTVWDQ